MSTTETKTAATPVNAPSPSPSPINVACPACNCPACAACPKCPDCSVPGLSATTDVKNSKLDKPSESFISFTNPLFLGAIAIAIFFFLFYTEMGNNLYNKFTNDTPQPYRGNF